MSKHKLDEKENYADNDKEKDLHEQRKIEDQEEEEEDDEWVGPLPGEVELNNKEASSKNDEAKEDDESSRAAKKPKRDDQLEKLYMERMPTAENYETSYMHRDVITFLVVTLTDFVITGSADGHVKFWKKQDTGIEFVKHFRSHLGQIVDMTDNFNGTLLCTVATDKAFKIFDIVNFDMINMGRLDYMPYACCFIHSEKDPISALCITDKDSPKIYIYDARGSSSILHVLEKVHRQPVHLVRFNSKFDVVVSSDKSGMLEYWTGASNDYAFPKNVNFESKMDTDLYEYVKIKTSVINLTFSRDGRKMAILSRDRKIRLFNFLNGKIVETIDESLDVYTALQQNQQQLANMEFGRRAANEKDIERSDALYYQNMVFDESGMFLLYGTMLGVKLLNLNTLETMMFFGKNENARFMHIGLFQGNTNKPKAILTMEMKASANPNLDVMRHDPTLFCTAYKKNRFYLFSTREPDDVKNGENERDVFNEKPSKEEIVAATEESSMSRLASTAVIHTTLGDITCTLFLKETPKTVENFAVLSRNGYYNGHIFHRVIKQFMIQTGDPTGTGTGGTSIWGKEFEDEFHPSLKHDKPYMLSMANAGPNTNGSQFFITVIPCPWLDKKHTVFGRVVKGMDVAQRISNVKTDKQDKPVDEIKIISVTVK